MLIKFPFDPKLISVVKTLPNTVWTQTHKAWSVPFMPETGQHLKSVFSNLAIVDDSQLNAKIPGAENSAAYVKNKVLNEASIAKIAKFKSWLRSKRYAENTIKTYTDALQTFLKFYADKAIAEITTDDIVAFNNNYILKNKFSASFQNQVVNAVKLFYKTVENEKIEIDLIHRPKRAKVLPNVLSKEEVEQILKRTENLKHKAMLYVIYSCGLRRGEMLGLKLNDVDSGRGLLIIRNAKGNKDRVTPLSVRVIELLRSYYKSYKPLTYLFEGQRPGEK